MKVFGFAGYSGTGKTTLIEQLIPRFFARVLRMSPCDLVLVEGYKHASIPKLEIHRPSTGRPLLCPDDPNIVAVAADAPVTTALPVLDLNDYDAIVAFMAGWLGLLREAPRAATDPSR